MIQTIQLIKFFDKAIGPILTGILPGVPKPLTIKSPKRILVIRPGGMGDALLLLPALKAARKQHPDITVDILCEPRNAGVFSGAPYIHSIYSYKSLTSLKSIFSTQYDLVVDTEQSHFLSAILTRVIKSTLKVGFKTNGRDKFYHIALPYYQHRYEAENFWTLFKNRFDLSSDFYFDFPYFEDVRRPGTIERLPDKFICLFPGATITERLWPAHNWAQIIDHMSNSGWHTILLGGATEIFQCHTILSLCKTDRALNMAGKLSIPETTTLFKKATTLISTDSGILHLGVLCGIPTISLFGSGIADKWAPKGKKHHVINKHLKCSPCTLFGTTPPCRNKNACMQAITPEDVIDGLRKLGIF